MMATTVFATSPENEISDVPQDVFLLIWQHRKAKPQEEQLGLAQVCNQLLLGLEVSIEHESSFVL
jgi:hypothetical protein